MFNVRLAPPVWEIAVRLAVAGDIDVGVFLCFIFPTKCFE